MNWKLSTTILAAGILVWFSYWGGQSYSVSALEQGDVEMEALDEASEPTQEPEPALAAEPDEPASAANPYEAYDFYNEEYIDRYETYQKNMPDLDAQSVVWHVNTGLDRTPYTAADSDDSDPLLVNKRHKLPDDYEPAELVGIHGNILATPGTAEAFRRMRNAAMQDGVFIEAAAGYRSLDRQRTLFEEQELYFGTQAAEEVVARPGYGEQSTGRALHIVDRDYTFDGFEETPEFDWLVEHCAEYGFILRYGEGQEEITGFDYKPYHFTFVGRETAQAMKGLQIETLEEYAARGLAPSAQTPIDDRIAVVIATGFAGGVGRQREDAIALRVKECLEEEDVRVVITRERADIERETKAAAVIGIDAGGSANRTVARFASNHADSRGLAETLCSRVSWTGVDVESRSALSGEKAALAGLTEAPAVFIEIPQAAVDATGSDGDKLAKSISDAVVAHLGIRKLYLTFDDGPSAKNTPKVLDILKENGVKATFFVIGEMAETHPDLLKRMVDEGHTIGIHCYRHDYGELYESVESFTDDFDQARSAIQEITGLEPVIYRFPGGSINAYNGEVYEQIIKEMDKRGCVYFDWNTSADDALGSVKAGQLIKNIKEYPRHRYTVLLMHDAYPYIVEELDEIIHYFSEYQMNVIEDDTVPVHL